MNKREIKWISVNDRLPERKGLYDDETEYVLVVVEEFDAITGEKLGDNVTICGYEKDGFSKWDNFGLTGTDVQNIRYWAYLPEAPESDGAE